MSASWPTSIPGMKSMRKGKGYQLTHSLIAFGRGEVLGQGLGLVGREAALPT